LNGESASISVEYLVSLSYGTLSQLERLEGHAIWSDDSGAVDISTLLAHRRDLAPAGVRRLAHLVPVGLSGGRAGLTPLFRPLFPSGPELYGCWPCSCLKTSRHPSCSAQQAERRQIR